MSNVNISGLSKAAVLAALYNASKPQGMGFKQFDPTPMGEEEAQSLLVPGNSLYTGKEQDIYFDYLKGRVMKVDLTSDTEFDQWGYDRDNGQGAAQRAIDNLRESLNAGEAQTYPLAYTPPKKKLVFNIDSGPLTNDPDAPTAFALSWKPEGEGELLALLGGRRETLLKHVTEWAGQEYELVEIADFQDYKKQVRDTK